MSMDKSAIEHIQQTAFIPEVLKQAVEAKTQVPLVTMPSNMQLESLEKYMPNAARYRLGFETTSIKDFMAYNELHDIEGATCFVDSERMSAKSIYDLGTVAVPGHKQNTGKLQLKKTAAMQAVSNISGERLKQKQAGEFIEDWADNIIAFTKEGDTMQPQQAARALQDLTIESAREINSKVDDFGESMSAMERIEAKNQELLPAEIHFKCEPYNGLSERKISIRVGLLTGDEKPKVVLRIMRYEQLKEDIADEFKDMLVKASENLKIKTFIGEA